MLQSSSHNLVPFISYFQRYFQPLCSAQSGEELSPHAPMRHWVYVAATDPRFLFSVADSKHGWLGFLPANEAVCRVGSPAGASRPLQSVHWKDSVHLISLLLVNHYIDSNTRQTKTRLFVLDSPRGTGSAICAIASRYLYPPQFTPPTYYLVWRSQTLARAGRVWCPAYIR